MSTNHSRRGRIRAVSFLVAAVLLLTGCALQARAENIRLRRTISNNYARAFSELSASLDKMDTALQKGQYVTTSTMLCSLCNEVYAQSQTGQMALGQLPLANAELEQTAEFLSTVGDYALALSQSAGRSGVYQEEEHTNWVELSQVARTLSQQLEELELSLIDGNFDIGDIEQAQARLDQEDTAEVSTDGFKAVESEFPEMPSLIYDGPFSQHLTNRSPAQLEGEAELTESEAEANVRRLLGNKQFVYEGTVEGDIPAYSFSCQAELGTCTIYLSKQGGKLLSFITAGTPSRQNLTVEQGLEAAEELLESLGYHDMEETYYQLRNNILTVNYCYEDELSGADVRCYTDLVKVSVSMEDGSALSFEGQGYLVNHKDRTFQTPSISRQQARETVSDELKVLESDLALIPTRGEHEVLCWEFVCKAEDGQRVITYINTQTGEEEKLLLLMEDENGTLAI